MKKLHFLHGLTALTISLGLLTGPMHADKNHSNSSNSSSCKSRSSKKKLKAKCPDGHLTASADYVIVGAGAGGCVVAARLAEAGYSVILLEAGPDTSPGSNDKLVQLDLSLIETPLQFISLYNRFNVGDECNTPFCGNWNATQSIANFVSTDQNGVYYSYVRGIGGGGSVAHHALQDGVGSLQLYDNIAKAVDDDYWKGSNIERLFKKMENSLFPDPSGMCGTGGWLSTQHTTVEAPLLTAISDAIVTQTGVPFRENFCNPQDVAGVGNASVQVDAKGKRSYAYKDLLMPVMEQTGRVQVVFNTLASEIILKKNKGNCHKKYKAVGVKAYNKAYLQEVQSGAAYNVVETEPLGTCTAFNVDQSLPNTATHYLAKKEVIVCGGAIQTPQLLMLSGIGPKEHLKSVGIKTKVNLPGVGSDLLDHTETSLIYEINPLKFIPSWQAFILLGNPGINANPAIKAICEAAVANYPNPLDQNTAQIQWDWYSQGQPPVVQPGKYPFPDTHSVPYETFFFNFDLSLNGPNYPENYFNYYHNNQLPDITNPFDQVGLSIKNEVVGGQFAVDAGLNPRVYLTWLVENLLPVKTPGTIRLASKDPRKAPIIREDLWKDDEGIAHIADMILQIRAMMNQFEANYALPGQPFEIIPGPVAQTRDDLIRYIKLWSSYGHHMSGTCQMGPVHRKTKKPKHKNSVLDSRCRVFGVDGLRVADTSVYVRPWLHAFNTSRAAYVVGEAVSEFIINDS